MRLQRLLGGDALAPLRRRLRERYARGTPPDAFTLPLAPAERQALEALLGRAARSAESMRLSHAELDAALQRAALAPSLRHALEALDGAIIDRAAERFERETAWSAAFAGGVAEPRLERWLANAAERGLLKRLAGADPAAAAQLLAEAATVLRRLPARGVARAQLAATTLGDAHGLDDGRPLATLVLAAADPEPPVADEDPEGARPRTRWARLGVVVGELSAPALMLNIPAADDTPGGALAEQAGALGEPLHLSLRLLMRDPPRWRVAGADVFVCENPSIVALAAERLGPACAPLVCTDGVPAAAQRTLLAQLAAHGARLRHHADFDAAGLVIGNLLLRTLGATQWRFGAGDYRQHAPRQGRRLDSVLVPAAWDAELAPAMAEHGHALDEEAMAEVLIADLQVARQNSLP